MTAASASAAPWALTSASAAFLLAYALLTALLNPPHSSCGRPSPGKIGRGVGLAAVTGVGLGRVSPAFLRRKDRRLKKYSMSKKIQRVTATPSDIVCMDGKDATIASVKVTLSTKPETEALREKV